MRIWLSTLVVAFIITHFPAALLAEEPATATGNVVDAAGNPVPHATVMVYSAGVKKGYSIFCPTCYRDCGKRSETGVDGNFAIGVLNPDLWFTLLVIKDGYSAAYIEKSDPAKGPAEATLKPRPAVEDLTQVVRGNVVDVHGEPLKDAVVEQQGVTFKGPRGIGASFGPVDWIDQAAVTNAHGDFEIAYGKPAMKMILQVSARGMAPKLFTEPTGAQRQTMAVTEGALIRGRLMYHGKPVANAEVGLTSHGHGAGTVFPEVRIGTREDGTFAITNIPAARIWLIYPKMESLASRGIGAGAVPCETKDDGQEVDVGDIQLAPAYTFRGQIVLEDGKPVPPDMHVTLAADRGWDSQIAPISPDGRLEFHGLPADIYNLMPAVKGYHLPEGSNPAAIVNRDVDNFVIGMELRRDLNPQ